MVLSKLILEKYLNNRFNAGLAEGEARGKEEGRKEGKEEGREEGREEGTAMGREQADREWRAWYDRMTDARLRGEQFDDPPPASSLDDEGSRA